MRLAGRISGDSVARWTEGWGRRVSEERTAEAARANQPGHRGERLAQRRLTEVAPITTQANISTDGAMMLVREEGWKEVKVVAHLGSAVAAHPAHGHPPRPAGGMVIRGLNCPGTATRRACGMPIRWLGISMPKGCGAAWTIVPSAVRSTMVRCGSSASRIRTFLASRRSSTGRMRPGISGPSLTPCTANRPPPPSKQWVAPQLDRPWSGQVAQVVDTLDQLDLQQPRWPDLVQEAPNYFRSNQDRMRYD